MTNRLYSLLFVPFLFAACNTSPPTAWLRYEPQDLTGWQSAGDGMVTTTMLGARVDVDLKKRDTRIELAIENDTGGDLRVRVGPEASQAPTAAIGELRRRRIDQTRAEDVRDFVPYVSMQSEVLTTGFSGTFFLDCPLGREPTIGQQIQLVLEVRNAKNGFERRLLSLVATNAGTLGDAPRR
jgi:hypothetical protein